MKSKINSIQHVGKILFLFSIVFVFSITNSACDKNDPENISGNGYATGKAIDTNGNPLVGAEVAVENTLVGYHSSANGATDTNGNYQINLSTVGTFHASAYLNKTFNGKQYKLALHCDNNEAFGNEGAVRNFEWKLTGTKPVAADGFYGAAVELYNEPGYYIDENDIVVALNPLGSLIDGSAGTVISRHPIVTSYAVLNDIPLGKYEASATYNGTPLKLKKLDSNQPYQATVVVEFEQEISSGTPVFRLSYKQ